MRSGGRVGAKPGPGFLAATPLGLPCHVTGAMPSRKRKRFWNVSFPEDTALQLKKPSLRTSVAAASISSAWLKCGDGFQSTSMLESSRPAANKTKTKKHLGPLLTTAESPAGSAAESSKEAEDIIWTSSGSDFSDNEDKTSISRLHSKKSLTSKIEKSQGRHVLLEDGSDEDESKFIDWEKDSESTDECDESEKDGSSLEISDTDSCSNLNSLPVKEENDELCMLTEISEYSSGDDYAEEVETQATNPRFIKKLQSSFPSNTGEVARPASDWLKSAQALLQTPKKQSGKASRTPEDSAKKRKLLRGGLAERLCRLQNRERSAISFWRHQSASDAKIPSDKCGVLIVKILEMFEECTIQVAICQQLEESPAIISSGDLVTSPREPILKVLFARETAAHLKSRPQDVIHIYPPWLCLLVQDAYGMFSEVQLQCLDSAEDIEQYCKRWEGKFCRLAGMKILQRTTRGRALGLFSLIDSLWPPVVPVKVPGQSQDPEMMTTNLPPPSFCYVLTAQSGEIHMEVDEEERISNLYQPPTVHNLKEILQMRGCNERCSFWARVLYLRPQTKHGVPVNQRETLLFVTDFTLQSVVHGIPKVVAVSVTASCVLSMEVIEALNVASQFIFFKDALWGNGRIICVERTVLLLQKPLLCSAADADLSELPGPVKLDELDSTTQANSICAVRGTVVGVNESTAFSWPTCDRCGNGKLELYPRDSGLLYCNQCSEAVVSPVLKMQLEVFLSCPSSQSQRTVKVKLLQRTISSLLVSAANEDGSYEASTVLGKELGPLPCVLLGTGGRMEEVELLPEGPGGASG
ncbi:DNA repair-scaffolding protein isoform X3 [Coturnix japonica]|uniref:DNA repair-scaffolding protein isoform X3 n=1 Tax=Coturnix japonica TaxID=93934 RepID=UPI000777BFBA|nr:DNA repair-scaffolding protein isoform X3 [Coturnix japonica]